MNENNLWSQLIAAVDYVAALARPDLTVTGAIDEALRCWITEHLDPTDCYAVETESLLPWHDPDPLRTTLDRLLGSVPAVGLPDGHRIAAVIESALCSWLSASANRFNEGHRFGK